MNKSEEVLALIKNTSTFNKKVKDEILKLNLHDAQLVMNSLVGEYNGMVKMLNANASNAKKACEESEDYKKLSDIYTKKVDELNSFYAKNKKVFDEYENLRAEITKSIKEEVNASTKKKWDAAKASGDIFVELTDEAHRCICARSEIESRIPSKIANEYKIVKGVFDKMRSEVEHAKYEIEHYAKSFKPDSSKLLELGDKVKKFKSFIKKNIHVIGNK